MNAIPLVKVVHKFPPTPSTSMATPSLDTTFIAGGQSPKVEFIHITAYILMVFVFHKR